jgi:von Willebrand factor type A domain
MRRAALVLLLALVGLLAAVAGIPAAAAQESGGGKVELQDVTVQDGRIRFLVTGLERSSGPAESTVPVQLRVDGYAVAARAAVPEPEPGPRTTMLVIDTSGSMAGLLDEAKRAVGSFLDAAPQADRVGLVAFADRPLLLAPAGAPRAVVRDALRGLTAGGSTRLYDAVDLALDVVGTGGNRQVLVLSDGPDTQSRPDLPDLLARERAGDTRVDLVRIGPAGEGPADPEHAAIAEAGGGQVFPAQRLGSGTGAVTEVVPDPGRSWPWLAVGLAGMFAALSLAVVAVVALPKSVHGRRRTMKLVADYVTNRPSPASSARAGDRRRDGAVREGALRLADRVAARSGIGDRLAVQLDRAAVAWQPNEWILLCGGVGVAAAPVSGTLVASLPVGLLLGVAVGWLGPGCSSRCGPHGASRDSARTCPTPCS